MKLTPEISIKLIEILGEEKINKMHELIKSKPVSFSTLRFMIRREKILEDIRLGKSIKDLVNKHHISKMTIYRLIKNNVKNIRTKK